jgi:glutamine synthetase
MIQDLPKRIEADKVKFICLQFTDVTGTVKSTDLPVDRLEDMLKNGVWFDGSSVEGFARIQESDMLLRLDPATYQVLPWSEPERKRARILCDIHTADGKPFAGDPRGTLKRILAKVGEKGWLFNTGPRRRIDPSRPARQRFLFRFLGARRGPAGTQRDHGGAAIHGAGSGNGAS